MVWLLLISVPQASFFTGGQGFFKWLLWFWEGFGRGCYWFCFQFGQPLCVNIMTAGIGGRESNRASPWGCGFWALWCCPLRNSLWCQDHLGSPCLLHLSVTLSKWSTSKFPKSSFAVISCWRACAPLSSLESLKNVLQEGRQSTG